MSLSIRKAKMKILSTKAIVNRGSALIFFFGVEKIIHHVPTQHL